MIGLDEIRLKVGVKSGNWKSKNNYLEQNTSAYFNAIIYDGIILCNLFFASLIFLRAVGIIAVT